ncbi:hypothetical protein F4561_005961 [Lipingzhangella halophila]|uniref:Uncharacterized protein n=1 Tax=Lipingzhangella halophila TaxID=1783352 RepID=A0A7W7W5A4_9ACTN|nr:hypothetical protein [Lipingzhangella halophila]MBB4935067.1 hypothetical protein [Lipingzhangella halophila]
MAEEILEFIVMVDGGGTESEVLRAITERVPDATGVREDACQIRGNQAEVWRNEDADPSLAGDDEEGYLYYPWRVEVTPESDDVDEDAQVALAGELLGAFRAPSWRAVLAATFEDRVE